MDHQGAAVTIGGTNEQDPRSQLIKSRFHRKSGKGKTERGLQTSHRPMPGRCEAQAPQEQKKHRKAHKDGQRQVEKQVFGVHQNYSAKISGIAEEADRLTTDEGLIPLILGEKIARKD
ncbi:hypothetical protein [Agrobacterium sp. RAC06]|uniref:hypothetical protein n=1 Tax=Agrobacterium sp. RAC06 TaxID=1842536 RepID=UPI001495B5B6|nr:hypothetical protein [Agrobacterium sp. RAC06]